MTTTIFPFTPSLQGAPTFAATLEGVVYNFTITWNVARQDYYLNCYNVNRVLQFSVPIVASLNGAQIQSLVWDEPSQSVIATTASPHGYGLCATIALTIAGALPAAFNGAFQCLVTGPSTFAYPMATDPGSCTVPGSASNLISLCAPFFLESTLIFRNNSFEVSP